MKIIKFIIGLFLLIITYLTTIIFSPWIKVEPQPFTKKAKASAPPSQREDFSCEVDGETVRGWFYRSHLDGIRPCVVMSHGFGGTKDGIMEEYALKFIKQNFHVITYDFRFFGESDGEPRQLYSGKHQLEDLTGVIKYAKSRDDVKDDAIILWGTSAGAHLGLLAASKDSSIAGVIGQCGAYDHHVDGKYQVSQVGYFHFIKLFMHAQRDKGRSRFNLPPHMIPAYGHEGTLAMFNLPGIFEHVEEISLNNSTFINAICARSLISPHAGAPVEAAKSVKCPVLFQRCLNDSLVSKDSQTSVVNNLGELATQVDYPINHFEIYVGEYFKKAVSDQINFINTLIV